MPSNRSQFLREKLSDCLRSLVLLSFTAGGLAGGAWLNSWVAMPNFIILPWAGGFVGLLVSDVLTQ